tara:strand:+ start:2594 stop:3418 length:825 start_codon:yes stop_codon:yes gene_type:complete
MLSDEQQNELAAALEGLNLGEEPAAQAPEPEPVEVQEEASEPVHESEAPEEVALDASDETDEVEDESGHNVPYSRFSKVIAAKNQYADEAETLRQEVDRLRQAEQELETLRRYNMNQPQQTSSEESYDYDDVDPYDKRLAMLENRLVETEREATIREHMSQMEQQIATIQQEHPNVDPIALLQHVQQNPDADLMELATSEAARVAEMRESVIAEYLESNPNLQQQAPATPPDVPPEVRNKSNNGSRGFAGSQSPSSWEDAHAQARKAIEAAWTG